MKIQQFLLILEYLTIFMSLVLEEREMNATRNQSVTKILYLARKEAF